MSVTLYVPVEVSEQTWEDLIVGSGFDTFSWWGQIGYQSAIGVLSGQVEDPAAEDEGVFIEFQVTIQEIADAASSLAKREKGIAEGITSQDLDASDVDAITSTVARSTAGTTTSFARRSARWRRCSLVASTRATCWRTACTAARTAASRRRPRAPPPKRRTPRWSRLSAEPSPSRAVSTSSTRRPRPRSARTTPLSDPVW